MKGRRVDVGWDGRRGSDGGTDGGRDNGAGGTWRRNGGMEGGREGRKEEWREGGREGGPRIHPLLPSSHLCHLLSVENLSNISIRQ
jgi:hypothetical protein